MEDRKAREEAHAAAFRAFDLDGSGEICSVDIPFAVAACDDLENIEITEQDLTWAMRRHGVKKGGIATKAQFGGVAEALWKRRIEPRIKLEMQHQEERQERERRELAAAMPVKNPNKRLFDSTQDKVGRAFYAFDTDNSGEVSGVDLNRMLQMTGIKQFDQNKLSEVLFKIGKARSGLFQLAEFRTIYCMMLDLPLPSTGQDSQLTQSTQQQQQPLPAGLPPPIDASQLASTCRSDISNLDQPLTCPTRQPDAHVNAILQAAHANSSNTATSLPIHLSQATTNPEFTNPLMNELQNELQTDHMLQQKQAERDRVLMEELARHEREEEEAMMMYAQQQRGLQNLSATTESHAGLPNHNSLASSPIFSNQNSCAEVPEFQQFFEPLQPLRKVHIVGDKEQVRMLVEAHPAIQGWNDVYETHVGATAAVLRDMPSKGAVGVRFGDGTVAWYPRACVCVDNTVAQTSIHSKSKIPSQEIQRTVGVTDLPLGRLINKINFGGLESDVSSVDSSVPPGRFDMANMELSHHFVHNQEQHVVIQPDEHGNDLPLASSFDPERIDADTDDTSLPPQMSHTRYCPPQRGEYKMPDVPKYDITELDAIYPLGKKKSEVKDPELELIFTLFDCNNEREVPRRDLHTMLKSLGYVVPRLELEALFSNFGKSESGNMMLSEFKMLVKDIGKRHKRSKKLCSINRLKPINSLAVKSHSQEDLRSMYFLFAENSDSEITRKQLTICLNSLGLDDTFEVDVFLEVDNTLSNPNQLPKDITIPLGTFLKLVKQLQTSRFAKHLELIG